MSQLTRRSPPPWSCLAATIEAELTDTWPLLRAGAFGGELSRAQKSLAALTEWKAKHGQEW
ncbi:MULTISPECIES: hypothetical protein [Streptomyces]|uniref:Uncharacterized protein n=1 Tax=Streptomyces flaveolus TaxID=67297 RepID=A0ABV3AP60_9ACTN|nr:MULTISPECIES: hypothetical protein [Streptomyces]KMS89910.1 hypothetical protein ACZ91_18035 [Streptomyces regensis]KOG72334.1 hypothetical protein ADK77_10525 [Streptomyces antibioticus]